MLSTRMFGVVSKSSLLSAVSPWLSGARLVPRADSPPKQCTESMLKLLRLNFGVVTSSPPGRGCKFGLVAADARLVPKAVSPPKQCTESMPKLLRLNFGVVISLPPGRGCNFGLVAAGSQKGGKEEKGQSGKALGNRGEIMCFY